MIEPTPTPEQAAARFERLQNLGLRLAGTRKEAVEGRKASGIEDVWRQDEEHYEGIDDLNRHESLSAWASKPPGQLQPQTSGDATSTVFVNITRPYVDAAAAKIGDLLLPTDERSWSVKETPIPELAEKAEGKLPLEVIEGMAQAGLDEETALQVHQAEAEHAQALIEEAKEKAKKAEKRIEDWHVEGQWHAQVRRVIDDAARIGTGVLKGPVPEKKRRQMYRDDALVIEEVTKPISKRVDAWDCFPDPACGDSIHNGRYHWERDHLTAKQLHELRRDETYIAEQIAACLEEGPSDKSESRRLVDGKHVDDDEIFEVWYFYGFATREDLEASGCGCPEEGPVMVPAHFILVNNRVIRGALNHLDTGEFPYDYMPWQRQPNSPWGQGVGRQIRTPQRMVTAATRVMLTNAGRAAGPILVLRHGTRGADGKNDVAPWKVYYAPDSDAGADAQKAAQLIEIPARTKELMEIIQMALKLAEDVTGLPLLLQGQSGSAPETLGGQQLVDRNAAGVLRRIARTFDDCITEPHVRRYYVYLLMYGEEDFEKGEFVIDARGSTALVDKDLYRQETEALLAASLNPAFGIDPKRAMAENLRAKNRDPKAFQFTEEEKQAQAQQPPPPNPQKEVAEIRAQTDLQKADMVRKADLEELRFKSIEAARERQHQREMKAQDYQIKLMEYAQQRGISAEDAKVELAKVVMQLRTQVQLAGQRRPQVAKPPTEPPGRAATGRAYEQ